MKKNRLTGMVVIVLLILGIAYWSASDEGANAKAGEEVKTPEALKPWQYRRLEIDDAELASVLNVWVRKYEFRVPEGRYETRVWVEEQNAGEAKPRTVLKFGKLVGKRSDVCMLVSLPTKQNPHAYRTINGCRLYSPNAELVLDVKPGENFSSCADHAFQTINTFAVKTPLVLETIEYRKEGSSSTPADRVVRLCVQFDPMPDPKQEKSK